MVGMTKKAWKKPKRMSLWRIRNRERYLAGQRRWRNKNKKRRAAYMKVYWAANAAASRIYRLRERLGRYLDKLTVEVEMARALLRLYQRD